MNPTQRTGNALVIEVRITMSVRVDLSAQMQHISEAVVNLTGNKCVNGAITNGYGLHSADDFWTCGQVFYSFV